MIEKTTNTSLEQAVEKEKQLVKDFIQNFYNEMGYCPTVYTNNFVSGKNLVTLSLQELKQKFIPFLPYVHGRQLGLSSKSRTRELVEIRFIFFYLARQMGYKLKEIGKQVGKKDHTTVIHGLITFRNLYETSLQFRNKVHNIINHIKQKNESPALDHLDKVEFKSEPDVFVRLLQE